MAAIAPASGQTTPPLKLKGRIRQSCVRGILENMPIDEFCRTLQSLGIVGVDLVGQSDWPAIKDHGLSATMVPGAGGIKDGLNNRVNHPGYMCDKTTWGVELCQRVASPNFKLLYDIYYMQIMEGDIIRTINDNIQFIDHFHTAGNPGRRDLDEDQELFYPAIMRTIAKLTEEGKFEGYAAHEFSPKKGVESLRSAVHLCDV